jgi:hypothetical protein
MPNPNQIQTLDSRNGIVYPDAGTMAYMSQGTGQWWVTQTGAYWAFLGSLYAFGWCSVPDAASGQAPDLLLSRDAADTLAQRRGNSDQKRRLYGANSAYTEDGASSELIAIGAQ